MLQGAKRKLSIGGHLGSRHHKDGYAPAIDSQLAFLYKVLIMKALSCFPAYKMTGHVRQTPTLPVII